MLATVNERCYGGHRDQLDMALTFQRLWRETQYVFSGSCHRSRIQPLSRVEQWHCGQTAVVAPRIGELIYPVPRGCFQFSKATCQHSQTTGPVQTNSSGDFPISTLIIPVFLGDCVAVKAGFVLIALTEWNGKLKQTLGLKMVWRSDRHTIPLANGDFKMG